MGASFRDRIGSALGRSGGAVRRRRAVVGRLEVLEPRVVLSTFAVTSSADDGPGSLRDAIQQANKNPDPDRIEIAPTVSGPILLNSQLPTLLGELTIAGPDPDARATIARNPDAETPEFRIITIEKDANVALNSLVLSGGRESLGGGVFNAGILSLEFSTVTGNSARFKGGGVYNEGSFSSYHATIDSNAVESVITTGFGPIGGGRGGGVYNDGWASLLVSAVTNNQSNREGGGLYNEGTLTIRISTVSGNSVEGFVLAGGLVPFGRGGGVYNTKTVMISDSTIVENSANSSGGGIFSNVNRGGSNKSNPYRVEDSQINSSIVANNVGGNLVVGVGTFLSTGHNLFGDVPDLVLQPNDLTNTDPMLTPLGDHGGFTPTHALRPGSPAPTLGFGWKNSPTTSEASSVPPMPPTLAPSSPEVTT